MTKTLSRRTMLRGAGALLGLPLLEAMEPRAFAAGGKPPVRLAVLYMPNGVNPHHWNPGPGMAFADLGLLKPLEPLRKEVLVLSNLTHKACETGDGHYVKIGGFLTGTTITKTTGSDVRSNGVSMDQLAAQRIGILTPLPSLELGIEPVTKGVDLIVGYTRLYGSYLAWSSPTLPVAKEINPKLAFDRLFRSGAKGPGKGSESDRSVLDLVGEEAKRLQRKVGQADRAKLEEYLESVRAVERRIELDARRRREEYEGDPAGRKAIEELGGRLKEYADPAGLRENGKVDHTGHVRLMLDLIALALWTDTTRVSTFMFGNEVSGKNFSFLEGVHGGHHHTSHHEKDPVKLEEYRRIGVWFLEQYAYFLGRLASMKEGEGTLLDHSMAVFGSGIRDGNAHSPVDVPIVVGGRGGGALNPGRHLSFPDKTPLCNLWLSLLRRMDVKVDSFADSTGELPGLG